MYYVVVVVLLKVTGFRLNVATASSSKKDVVHLATNKAPIPGLQTYTYMLKSN